MANYWWLVVILIIFWLIRKRRRTAAAVWQIQNRRKQNKEMPTFSLRDRFAYRKWTSKFHLVCFTIFCRGCSLYVAKCLAKVAGRRKAENAGNLRWCKVGFGQ